ncbi:MAG: S-adenosylmethionine:tRNA ribosyltransferase-isomerase [Chitinophagaceae bacterium]|nr:S-adenosylmethionine:tRNA ribosyltransferase-isomerase [Chitinophagaceae bacterium]
MQTDPRLLEVIDFDYELPAEKIALHPLSQRDASKLLIYKEGVITDTIFSTLPSQLQSGTCLVFNQTKVVPARLVFEKSTGGQIEVFCLEPANNEQDMNSALSNQSPLQLQCLVGGASKWKRGSSLTQKKDTIELSVEMIEKTADAFILQFHWSPANLPFSSVLETFGQTPLPPYLKRKANQSDSTRYQTVYASQEGSVAAPTAGLHFTPKTLEELQENKIRLESITLHVGAGTFKPVKAAQMQGHEMHQEWIDVDLAFLEKWRNQIDSPLIAVGTTSLRTLESLYWLGVKVALEPADKIPMLSQWECYELEKTGLSIAQSLDALIQFLQKKKLDKLVTQTALLIAPGYTIKTVDALVTNFHQPRSTLLLLIAAFIGEDWKKVYQHALNNDYRFLSYGDSSLLWRQK